MTTLRDDGLETDDVIVGACFGGKIVKVIGLDEPDLTGRLISIPDVIDSPAGVFTVCDDETEDCRKGLSLLVPAATVAEVWGDQPGLRLRHGVILAALDETSHDDDIHETVLYWMDEHTKENTGE